MIYTKDLLYYYVYMVIYIKLNYFCKNKIKLKIELQIWIIFMTE